MEKRSGGLAAPLGVTMVWGERTANGCWWVARGFEGSDIWHDRLRMLGDILRIEVD